MKKCETAAPLLLLIILVGEQFFPEGQGPYRVHVPFRLRHRRHVEAFEGLAREQNVVAVVLVL